MNQQPHPLAQILALMQGGPQAPGQAPQHPGYEGPMHGARNFLQGGGLLGHILRARAGQQGEAHQGQVPPQGGGFLGFGDGQPGALGFGSLGRFLGSMGGAPLSAMAPRTSEGQLRPQARPDQRIPPREERGPMSAASDRGRALYEREASRNGKPRTGRGFD